MSFSACLAVSGIDRGDGGHRMAVIERLVARHAVVEDVVHAAIAVGEVGQVGAR